MKLHTDLGGNTTDVSVSGMTDDTASISSYSEYSTSSRSMVPQVLIVYGSETGNAESVARRIKSRFHLLKATFKSLDEMVALDKSPSRLVTHVICVCSTFGKGKPPSNACKFFESELPPKLAAGASEVKYAVLGLGSTIYPEFCAAAVALDAKFDRCGYKRLCPLAKVDEAAGADEAISVFVDLVSKLVLPPELERALQAMQDSFFYDPPVHAFKWCGDVDMDRTRWSDDEKLECLSNDELLNHPGKTASSNSTHKVTFQLPEGTCYETGDHACVNPVNSGALIKRFLKLFEHELVLGVDNPLANDTSTEECLSFMANHLFGLECIQEDEMLPADV
jgi:sulfite reductase alpha subunit-like flavoprotein